MNANALERAARLVHAMASPPPVVRFEREDGVVIGYRANGEVGLVMNERDFDSWARATR